MGLRAGLILLCSRDWSLPWAPGSEHSDPSPFPGHLAHTPSVNPPPRQELQQQRLRGRQTSIMHPCIPNRLQHTWAPKSLFLSIIYVMNSNLQENTQTLTLAPLKLENSLTRLRGLPFPHRTRIFPSTASGDSVALSLSLSLSSQRRRPGAGGRWRRGERVCLGWARLCQGLDSGRSSDISLQKEHSSGGPARGAQARN